MKLAGTVAGPVAAVAISTLSAIANSQTTVTVQADQNSGPVTTYTGFIHGFSPGDVLPAGEVSAMKPQSWRIKEFGQYPPVATFTSNITYVLSDGWLWQYQTGNILSANPAADWAVWEAYVGMVVHHSIDNGLPIAWWDIWNEPDHGAFWDLDGLWGPDTLLETFKRAHDVIKSIDPNARILGPSFASFDGYFTVNPAGASTVTMSVSDFVSQLVASYAMRLDAISWHQNDGLPLTIPAHAASLRATISGIDPEWTPQLNINEYASATLHFQPLALAAYIDQMDRAGIDFASLACWNAYLHCGAGEQSFSTCWAGLDGSYLGDYTTRLAPYWFWRWHGAETGVRLVSNTDDPQTFALASLDQSTKAMRITLGRYQHHGTVDNVEVRLVNYLPAADSVRVSAQVIPASTSWCTDTAPEAPEVYAMPDPPELILDELITATGPDVVLSLPSAADDSLFLITIAPQTDGAPSGQEGDERAASGCACRAGPQHAPPPPWMLLVLWWSWLSRRRRRAGPADRAARSHS